MYSCYENSKIKINTIFCHWILLSSSKDNKFISPTHLDLLQFIYLCIFVHMETFKHKSDHTENAFLICFFSLKVSWNFLHVEIHKSTSLFFLCCKVQICHHSFSYSCINQNSDFFPFLALVTLVILARVSLCMAKIPKGDRVESANLSQNLKARKCRELEEAQTRHSHFQPRRN